MTSQHHDQQASENHENGLRVVLLTYEFTFSPFSGNGILARSLVKSLLKLDCHITVWCCQPTRLAAANDNHLGPPEISKEQADRLRIYAVTIPAEQGWRRLDMESGWREFNWDALRVENDESRTHLAREMELANVVCVIDWTGGCAWRSVPCSIWERGRTPSMVYLNFRVYSSGVSNANVHEWYDDMECQVLKDTQRIIALSEQDKESLENLMDTAPDKNNLQFPARQRIHVLHPPLRGDMEDLVKLPPLCNNLPPQVASAILESKINHQRCFLTCVVRLSPEKDAMRFVKFVEATSSILSECGLIPLLAGSAAHVCYAESVKSQLRLAAPQSVIVESFLSPTELAAVFSRTALNFHPCSYDAFGMTIVEAAAFGVPSVVSGGNAVGATAIVGGGAFEVDMQPPSKDGVPELSEKDIKELQKVLQDRKRMEDTGAIAKTQALAWDERAYGSKLMEYMRDTIALADDIDNN